MSWKPEVIADSSGKWVGNALRFATKEEAEGNAKALAWKWVLVREWRVAESAEPVNYEWKAGRLLAIVPESMAA
jgi:hypothetical protein